MTTKTKPKKATLKIILEKWEPCYSEERLHKLAGRRKSISAAQILELDIPHDDKMWAVLRNDFFTDRELRELAADFAEHTLPIFERKHPNDSRPRECVEVARRYARGEATGEELAAAAAAARAAAWAAARAAAAAAARAAAWDAARAAAAAAAWVAARDAARAAARAAAWAAARDAARAAAWAAARDAARAAENKWQIEKVKEYLARQ